MQWLEAVAGSSALGSTIGFLGSLLTRWEERKKLKLKYEFDLQMAELRISEAKLEYAHELQIADKNISRTQIESETQRHVADTSAFSVSLAEQAKMYGIWIVDCMRGSMRPLITAYLLILATYLAVKVGDLVGGIEGAFESDQLVALYVDIIARLLFLLSASVSWWFGSRPSGERISTS